MFPTIEIQKLLSGIIPSAPSGGIFEPCEITGDPFFDTANDAVITPVIRFKPFCTKRQGDEVLRGIYFILKKNESANAMVLIFSGTNERLSRITEMEFRQRIEGIAGSMLESLAKVR